MSWDPTHSSFKNNDMRPNLLMTIILPLLGSCQSNNNNIALLPDLTDTAIFLNSNLTELHTIDDIPLPRGYKRMDFSNTSFAIWLRKLPVKKDRRVFLYNGELKSNQDAQYAVLDVPVGKKNLQQCADAIMRLRAQYLLDQKRAREISFADNSGKKYNYPVSHSTPFESYLETVFSYCGTLSLERQLKKATDFYSMEPGDVLIKGGSPGHAVIVLDMAVNSQGGKIYLLAQSYMPAQNIHVLKNPANNTLNPWYQLIDNALIHTPEWIFEPAQLRKW
jgi:hypothetical protein